MYFRLASLALSHIILLMNNLKEQLHIMGPESVSSLLVDIFVVIGACGVRY